MVDQKKVEQIFDTIHEACVFLFEKNKDNYFDALLKTTSSIMEGGLTFEMEEEFENSFFGIISQLNRNYNTEEVRKALQYLIMNALKETRNVNTITPDTIAFLINYMVEKLYGNKSLAILDPLVGSANLLTAVANSRQETILYGIDLDEDMVMLAKMVGDMQNYEINLYNQDTLDVRLTNMDLIVSDLPNDPLFTYKFINHHLDSLRSNGYMILLVPNEFFTEINQELKKEIDNKASMISLIDLPNDFFVDKKKSVVIFKKSTVKIKDFLIAQMPSLKDIGALNIFLSKLEKWFNKGGN